MKTLPTPRLLGILCLLIAGLLSGCSDDLIDPEPVLNPDRTAVLDALELEAADLEGVDLDALVHPFDEETLIGAIRMSDSPASSKNGPHTFVHPGESIQAAVDAAPDGGTVFVRPGTYPESVTITRPLQLVGLGGPGAVVIQDPGGLDNGIVARNITGVSLINLTVRGFSRNGVFLVGVDGFLLFRLITDQLREGAYGLFPVRSRNGLIAHCTATGADDAGIYVGQSENVAVVHNEAYGNVIGLEAENVKQNVWAHNHGYENAAGMLAILLPPSQYISVLHAEELLIAHNRFTDNNGENYGEEGDLAALVPSGTGLLVIGFDDTVVRDNRVTGNGFVGIGLASTATIWALTGRDPTPLAAIDPHPDNVQIVRNRVTGNGFAGSALPLPAVDLLWDRPLFEAYGAGNCWEDNVYETSFPEELPSCETAL